MVNKINGTCTSACCESPLITSLFNILTRHPPSSSQQLKKKFFGLLERTQIFRVICPKSYERAEIIQSKIIEIILDNRERLILNTKRYGEIPLKMILSFKNSYFLYAIEDQKLATETKFHEPRSLNC